MFDYICDLILLLYLELFADILLPLQGGTYTYRVGEGIMDAVSEGMAVAVQFGQRKIQMGIIWRLHNEKPAFRTKDIDTVLLLGQVVSTAQMRLWEWVSEYYMSTLGDVMRFAVPSSLKPKGMSREEFDRDIYRPKNITYISLHPSLSGEGALNEACESLRRSRAQYAAVMEFIEIAGTGYASAGIERGKLSASQAVLKKLLDKGIFVASQKEEALVRATRVAQAAGNFAVQGLPVLTAAQRTAFEAIEEGFGTHSATLLQGVTGSGKTEIYMHLIARQLERGATVLYLMPEIGMTSQLV